MKKIAVISDIHSNIFALDAVLEDIKSKNVEMIVNLGDSLLGPVDPVNTAKRLMMVDNIVNIMGNGDEKLLQNEISSPTAKYVKSMLDEETLEWLKTFKRQWIYENILFCHGSPSGLKCIRKTRFSRDEPLLESSRSFLYNRRALAGS